MPRVTKKKRVTSGRKLTKADLREIRLVAMNTQSIYRQADAFALNYAKKKVKGIYNRRKAISGLANNLVPNVLKKVGISRTSSADKKKVAQQLLSWVNDMRDDIIKHQPSRLPKKYRKKR